MSKETVSLKTMTKMTDSMLTEALRGPSTMCSLQSRAQNGSEQCMAEASKVLAEGAGRMARRRLATQSRFFCAIPG